MEGEQHRKHIVLFLSSICSILELHCANCIRLNSLARLVLCLLKLCLGLFAVGSGFIYIYIGLTVVIVF